jgi:hypothetical protein
MIGIRCHLCRERFSWDIMKGYPTHCECCKQFIGIAEDAPEVATPYISTQKKRGNTDAIYRDMENKSVARAEMAAAETGQTMAEVSHLKMTDMKDNLKEGDQAFSNNLQNNPVHQAMQQAPAGATGFSSAKAMAIQASAGTRVGPLPNAGTNFIHGMGGLRDKHSSKYHAPVSSMPGNGTRIR